MKIVDVKAYPDLLPRPEGEPGLARHRHHDQARLRLVKVTTEDGIVGWGESHHARAPGRSAI